MAIASSIAGPGTKHPLMAFESRRGTAPAVLGRWI